MKSAMKRAWSAAALLLFAACGEAGAPGEPGEMGEAGEVGETGETGAAGQSVVVTDEVAGDHCAFGGVKLESASGTRFVCDGATALVDYASFHALMPGDNAATIAVGAAVDFPQDGPASGGIVRSGVSADTFVLPAIGTYEVAWQVSVTEPGQLVLALNGAELAATVVGRATGTNQLVGHPLVTTTVVDSTLEVRNPAGNSTALTITPLAGGTHPSTATLVIKRLA